MTTKRLVMNFEWDENKNKNKNKKNIEKHGIDFNDAKEVFKDEKRVTLENDRKDFGETRWLTIGAIFDAIFSVVYTIRETTFRIISARNASRKERKEYDKHNNQENE